MSYSDSESCKAEFSVRIVVCDHYLTKPIPGVDVIYSEFRGADIKQVPILRIFGPTPTGRKTCLHVHGVFPYFYVPCPTQNPQPQFLYQIAASLDKALNIALKQASSTNQHVYKITLVKGLPFYGFHDKDHLFLKIFLYNPGLLKQAVELCSNGAILGQTFQPHESHLNFTLQFFIDFNLFGMSNLDLQTVKFRKSGILQTSDEVIDSLNETYLKPESICFYEADCNASHIINRQRVGKGDGMENPGLEEVWNQEKERRKRLNMSMASKSLSQGRIKCEETESHYKFEQMFLIKLSNAIELPVQIIPSKVNEVVYYPAESLEGSQLFNAAEISMHLPNDTVNESLHETLDRDHYVTLTEDNTMDDTLVDEDIALNSSFSIQYSQVLLDNDDLELVDMLNDMDDKSIDEDSILGTPADVEKDVDVVDPEYSQAFQDDTIVVDPGGPVPSSEESITSWNDSFWDGANIPQLDGTCDDEDISRKRKMRPFKLGLGKPKSKINGKIKQFSENPDFSQDLDDIEEINVSREVLDNISDLHIRKSIKSEPKSFNSNVSNKPEEESVFEELGKVKIESITDLVNKLSQSQSQNTESVHGCDLKRNFEPMPGPSKVVPINDTFYDSIESSPEDKSLGILSFYNTSKIFDISNDNPQIKLQETLNASSSKVVESTNILTPKIRPPTKNYVLSTLQKYNIPKTKYCEPYFSDHKDVGDKVELGTMLLKINSKLVKDQKPFEKVLDTMSIEEWRQLLFSERNEITEESPNPEGLKSFLAGNRHCILEPIKKPPTKLQVIQGLEKSRRSDDNETNVEDISANVIEELENSQALGLNEDGLNESLSLESNDKDKMDQSIQITMQPDGSFLCFGNSVPGQESMSESPTVDNDFLTIMLAEVLASTRGGDLHPDPAIDPIQALFLTVTNDCPPEHFLAKSTTDILVVNDTSAPRLLDRCIFKANVTYVDNELELFKNMIALIQSHDPDIMCGYEIELTSWGYILERSQALGLEIINEISRITEKNRQKRNRPENTDIEGRIIGRISFNVWRLLRHELALSSYSFENCMFVVLKERVPTYSYTQLFEWWKHESRTLRWIPVEYYLARLSGTVRMLEKLDIINRTSELARLFGLQWWEVLSRGSQFRVESLMLRAARPLNLIACSPTVKQRAAMKAPEFLPLIFEPESRFYSDPVIVLDFQSLYPSMMIAYNYCFSTCIGRVQNIQGDSVYEFGAWRLRIPKSKLEALVKKGLVHWSPAGVGFVKSSMRRGVLPALLRRILAARQAVKKSMKQQTDEGVKKAMHSRQLGLKLIANVTYGYTAANFSGRMPCVEVGDSVVAKGRETLERAIRLVREGPWNVKVVYGDTDSMFVQVPGGTRADAFEIGQQIADAVTADNPSPVALKLEKVYQPCILQTKKRYVGYMYESPAQTQPVYEAKGIETVRRDGCPLGVQMLQTALCTLFSSGDMSAVKRGVVRQLARLVRGTVAAPELAFTRELRAPPPRAAPPTHIASRLAGRAGRRVPRAGWRLAWLVVAGPPAAPLVSLARSPLELLREPGAPHVLYYVTRVLLPPLHRCLSLLGADVFKWWQELNYTRTAHERDFTGGIARYLWRARCVGCEDKLAGAGGGPAVCAGCAREPASAAARVAARRQATSMHVAQCRQICQSCAGHSLGQCENTECPVLWRLQVAQQKHSQLNNIISHLPATFSREDLSF